MKSLDLFLSVLAFVPASILVFFSTGVFVTLIPEFEFEFRKIIAVLYLLLGIAGYIGIIFAMVGRLETKPKLILTLLSCGILSFILFNSFEGGTRAWKWIFTIEEPGEWFLLVWPTLVSIYFVIRAIRKLSHNN
ncbi:MAG: hypothetical protein WDZ35_14650 [Crocinitomicaceae bacterium]